MAGPADRDKEAERTLERVARDSETLGSSLLARGLGAPATTFPGAAQRMTGVIRSRSRVGVPGAHCPSCSLWC
jgi:hypothetical protein